MKAIEMQNLSLFHGCRLLLCFCFAMTVSSERLLGFPFNTAFWKGGDGCSCTGTIVCGTNAADNCYSGSTSAAAIAAGSARTPTCKCLVISTGASSFKVWTEQGGTKILKSTGLDAWQMTVNPNGRGFSSTFASTATHLAYFEGRRCPTNVFIDSTNMVATNLCLYYTPLSAVQQMGASNCATDQTTSYTLCEWNDAGGGNGNGGSWYEGNVQYCTTRGMRMPTLYETTSTAPSSGKPTDASPSFTTTGIPMTGNTWTATGNLGLDVYYFRVSSANAPLGQGYYQTSNNGIRCVLP